MGVETARRSTAVEHCLDKLTVPESIRPMLWTTDRDYPADYRCRPDHHPTTPLLCICVSLIVLGLGAGCQRKTAAASDPKSQVVRVDAPGAAALVKSNQVVVLDIRTPAEFVDGHVAGAVNIDFHGADFSNRLARLDRDQTYLLHCASGRRSQDSLPTFSALGFKSIVHLDGGIKAWKSAGLPVED
jgi:rhodanese-related sulfurtransferase